MSPKIEIVVEDVAGAQIVAREGADSIELCVDLDHGGLTPPRGLMGEVCRAVRAITDKTEIHMLILKKVDGFYPDADDIEALKQGIRDAKESGATGVVFGALTKDNRVDYPVLRDLIAVAAPMQTTFHRAFDRVRSQAEDLETLIQLGFTRLLTSGKPGKAPDHAQEIKSLVEQAGERILLLAGGGVRTHNCVELARATKVRMLHGSCRHDLPDETGFKRTDAAQVHGLVVACRLLK